MGTTITTLRAGDAGKSGESKIAPAQICWGRRRDADGMLRLPNTLICARWRMGWRSPVKSPINSWRIARRTLRFTTVLRRRRMTGGAIIRSLSPEGRYAYVKGYDGSQLVIAAATIAAVFAQTARFDPPAVYRYLDSPATAISSRGIGFRDTQLIALVPRDPNIAIRTGVAFGNAHQLACCHGWYLDGCASDVDLKEAGRWRGAF